MKQLFERAFMLLRDGAVVSAVLMLAAFAPSHADEPLSRCGAPLPQEASKAFVEGYNEAAFALTEARPDDAIRLANAIEPLAVSDRQRSSLSLMRQAAYSILGDLKALLIENEKQIGLGCLSPEQLRIQTKLVVTLQEKLGLTPPQN